MFKIIKRKVTQSEAELLVNAIKLTPNIMGYSYTEWLSAEHIIVAEDENGKMLGACLNYDFHEHWSKIAALFVFEEFRSRGIGKSLFYQSCQDALNRNKNIYTISANKIIIKMMADLNFVMFNNLSSLAKNNQQYQVIFYWHSLLWLMNFYRIQEITRKSILYKHYTNFVYGIKLNN